MMRRMKSFWQILVGLALAVLGLAWVAWGATYNFYFNNTEQGANSTATPSVTVHSDGTVTKSTDNSGPQPQGVPSKIDVPAQAPAQATSIARADVSEPESHSGVCHWIARFGATGFKDSSVTSLDESSSAYGGELDLGYRFNKTFGLGLYGGWGRYTGLEQTTAFGGFEGEVLPFHMTVGPWEDAMDLGVVLGGTTLGHAYGNVLAADGGVRMNINLGEPMAITATFRANASFAMATAGITFRM